MTPEEKEAYKRKVRASLSEYLVANNLQNAPGEVLRAHLESMYRRLENAGLVQHGLKYHLFCSYFENSYQAAKHDEMLQDIMFRMAGKR